MWPAVRIAPRSLMEIPITLEPGCAIFNSSPIALTSIRFGDDPVAPGPPPSRRVVSSDTLVTERPVVRSYHSLPTIPLTDGVAPLRNVECPTAVTVGE